MMNCRSIFRKKNQIFGMFLWLAICPSLFAEQVNEGIDAAQKKLDDALIALDSENLDSRSLAMSQIIHADESMINLYIRALQEPLPENRYPLVSLRGMVWAIWGQFPNPTYGSGKAAMWYIRNQGIGNSTKGKPTSTTKDAAETPAILHDPEAVDWALTLLHLQEKDWKSALSDLAKEKSMHLVSSKSMAPFSSIRAQMLFRIALLQALARLAPKNPNQVVRAIFDFSFLHQGVFRDECGKTIRNLGEYAVPELTRIAYTRYGLKDKEAKSRGEVVTKDKDRAARVRYANYQLERLDRQSAKKALKSAGSKAMQVELMNVYGEVQYRNAVEPIFSYLNDSSTLLRLAARKAWMQYVEGPAPDTAPARRWKRPGGVVDAHATPDYANFRQLAEALLRKKLDELHLPVSEANVKQMTKQLFAAYDAETDHRMDRFYKQAKEAELAGKWKEATDLYQWILAQQPTYANRFQMAEAFYQQGEMLAIQGEKNADQKLISQGLGYLHKALLLHPKHPKSVRIKARIHYLDGKQAQALGGDGLSDFQQAVDADPTYDEAKQQLERQKR